MKISEDYPVLSALLESWMLALRAERKSQATLDSYARGVRTFIEWCESANRPLILNRDNYNGFSAAQLEAGKEANTVVTRQVAVRQFSSWLYSEQEIPTDELANVKTAKLDSKVIEPLTDGEIKAFLKTFQGTKFTDRRDEAIFRLMLETGIRAEECVKMTLEDVNLLEGTAIVRKGKGGKGRIVPFGSQTARALDRYKRMRAKQPAAYSDSFWIGAKAHGFSYYALHKTLAARARAAGVERFHPHLLRHTAANRWLAAGGSEGGLMSVAGWTRPDMLQRYTKARASERAAEEARKLNLGDI